MRLERLRPRPATATGAEVALFGAAAAPGEIISAWREPAGDGGGGVLWSSTGRYWQQVEARVVRRLRASLPGSGPA